MNIEQVICEAALGIKKSKHIGNSGESETIKQTLQSNLGIKTQSFIIRTNSIN